MSERAAALWLRHSPLSDGPLPRALPLRVPDNGLWAAQVSLMPAIAQRSPARVRMRPVTQLVQRFCVICRSPHEAVVLPDCAVLWKRATLAAMGKKDKRELSFDGEVPLEQVVDLLQELSEQIGTAHFNVSNGQRSLSMQSGPIIGVALKAKAASKENTIKLQLRWEPGELNHRAPVRFAKPAPPPAASSPSKSSQSVEPAPIESADTASEETAKPARKAKRSTTSRRKKSAAGGA